MASGGVADCAATRGSDGTTADDAAGFGIDSSKTDRQVLAIRSQFHKCDINGLIHGNT